MSTKIAAVALALAVGGAVYGIFSSLDSADLQRQLEGARSQLESANSDLEEARAALVDSQRENEALQSQIQQLLGQIKAGQTRSMTSGPTSTEGSDGGAIVKTSSRQFGITSVQEADELANELNIRGDIEGLWVLATELLALGEPGYEKLIELAALLDDDQGPMREATQTLWRHEELIAGKFLQTLMTHSEDVLKLGLYLDQRQGELPELLRDFDREMEDEMGVMLLGMYSGDDPEVLDGYTERLERKINDDLRRSNDAVRALGGIRTQRSADVLLALLDRAEGRMLDTVVQALAWQKDPRALAELRRLRVTISDPARGRVIDAAIRYLE